jgi:hypothetical protein
VGASRRVGECSRLGIRQLREVAQGDNQAVVFGELPECTEHGRDFFTRDDCVFRPGDRRVVLLPGAYPEPFVPFRAAHDVVRFVDDYPQEPGPERRAKRKAVE